MWLRTAIAAAVVAAHSVAGAQPPPPQAGQAPPPVFGAAVELVRLDVIVLDKDGKPVSGLARGDFEVEEGGKAQTIESFEPVVIRSGRPAAADEPPRLTVARLRAPSEGRCVLLFVDDMHVAPPSMVAVRRAIQLFLEKDVREGDWVTLFAPEEQLWWTARGAWEYRQLGVVAERLVGQGSGDSYRRLGRRALGGVRSDGCRWRDSRGHGRGEQRHVRRPGAVCRGRRPERSGEAG